jgi:hypothetical protein
MVFGHLPHTIHAVTLELAGGERLHPRVRRVRGLGRVWTAILPRHQQLRALRYTGKLGTRPFRVLPAARQCGYENQIYTF